MQLREQQKKWVRLATRFTVVLFLFSVVLMVHDSLGVSDKLTPDEVQQIMAARPILVDPVGQPAHVTSEQEYEKLLASGIYRAAEGATVPFISPQGKIASIDPSMASLAFVKGWKVESLEHQAERILESKQKDSMWLSDWPGLFLHVVLCQFSAILLLGAIVLAKSVSNRSFFAFIGTSSDI